MQTRIPFLVNSKLILRYFLRLNYPRSIAFKKGLLKKEEALNNRNVRHLFFIKLIKMIVKMNFRRKLLKVAT